MLPPTDTDAPVYFLLHVPKTAGQTIQRHLVEHAPAGSYWQPPPPRWGRLSRRDPQRRLTPSESAAVRAVSGHHVCRSMERLFPGRDIRRCVLLRDPVSLCLSLYNFRMMSYLGRGLGTYGFDLHLRGMPRNFMAHFLLSSWLEIPAARLAIMSDQRQYELVNELLSSCWFVGAHTDCDGLIAAVAPDLAVPRAAKRFNTGPYWQAQVPWRMLTEAKLPAAALQAIAARNPVDHAIWQVWRKAGFAAGSISPPPLPDPADRPIALHQAATRGCYIALQALHRDASRWRRLGRVGRIAAADAARDAARWDDAARRYARLVRECPTPALWVQYANALKESGHPQEAEPAYREALRLKPDNPYALLLLANMQYDEGRREEAARNYLGTLRLAPDMGDAREILGRLGWTERQIAVALNTPAMAPRVAAAVGS